MSGIVFMVWCGGVPVAYRQLRKAGGGWFGSGIDALVWPFGVGAYLAANAFDPSYFD